MDPGTMSEEEKRQIREEWARRAEGYRLIDADRRERIRRTVTKDAMVAYGGAAEVARRRPLRSSSGLEEWYRYLSRTR